MVAAGGKRRSKRVKVAPTRYDPVVEEEEESLTGSPHASTSSGVLVTMHTTLTASPRPLENSIAADETTMNGSNEDTNIDSSRRASAVAAAAAMIRNRRKVRKTFDEHFKDLMAFKEEFGHCNVPSTQSKYNNYLSLGIWSSNVRKAYKAIKEGGISLSYKLSKADMKRLENAGFEWNPYKKFDDHFKDLIAFKAEFGLCNVPTSRSSNNTKHFSLGRWCSRVRKAYKANKEGGIQHNYKFLKADMKCLENAGFE